MILLKIFEEPSLKSRIFMTSLKCVLNIKKNFKKRHHTQHSHLNSERLLQI